MIYLIHYDPARKVSASFVVMDRLGADAIRRICDELDLIEVGPFSYWLYTHGFPRLAMLPFWR